MSSSLMNSIIQDKKYRQSLLTYAQKYGVSHSYIDFWPARYDGSPQSLACQSRRPYGHPNQHTQEEFKLISGMYWRNPSLESWGFGRECENAGIHVPSKAGIE